MGKFDIKLEPHDSSDPWHSRDDSCSGVCEYRLHHLCEKLNMEQRAAKLLVCLKGALRSEGSMNLEIEKTPGESIPVRSWS